MTSELHRPHPLAHGLIVAGGVVIVLTLASVVALAADVWGHLPAGLLLGLLVTELAGVVAWVRSRRPASAATPDPEVPARPRLSLVE